MVISTVTNTISINLVGSFPPLNFYPIFDRFLTALIFGGIYIPGLVMSLGLIRILPSVVALINSLFLKILCLLLFPVLFFPVVFLTMIWLICKVPSFVI